MNRTVWPLAALLSMALAACGSAATPAPTGSTAPALSRPAQANASPAAPVEASAAGWTRPVDVKPLPEAGIFKVVSETPGPGDKVPLFFMGAQG